MDKHDRERRAYPRHELLYQIAVGMHGLRRAQGTTLDISQGGLKACLNERTFRGTEGATCLVRFIDAREGLIPRSTLATLRRVEEREDDYVISLEFVPRLDLLGVHVHALGLLTSESVH